MHTLIRFDDWLPIIFMLIMGLAMLIYVILDGYDLGVGIIMPFATQTEKDVMISSIGPFWDANETWLVLGIGVLLTCFPLAHGVILGALYFPVALMLLGLMLRGAAFDFRAKASPSFKPAWNLAFFGGSLIATLSQGWMLGRFILGFAQGWHTYLFAGLIAVCLAAGYALLGACWLLLKTEHRLQLQAIRWAHQALWLTALGVIAISIATPLLSHEIFEKWFAMPHFILLMPIPMTTLILFYLLYRSLIRLAKNLPQQDSTGEWRPFFYTVGIFILAFLGLAYSLFPYLVINQMTIWQGAATADSLKIILIGVAIVLPVILAYTLFSYWVFRGKARSLVYTS